MHYDTGQTLDRLTRADLYEAAAVLRNAALVVHYAGHGKGSVMHKLTGAVCAVGAIELSTTRKAETAESYQFGRIFWHSPVNGVEAYTAEWNRCEAAVLVFAATIPDWLCQDCAPGKMEAYELCTHYNDHHCPGGTVAGNMLRLAAEKAEKWADSRSFVGV